MAVGIVERSFNGGTMLGLPVEAFKNRRKTIIQKEMYIYIYRVNLEIDNSFVLSRNNYKIRILSLKDIFGKCIV